MRGLEKIFSPAVVYAMSDTEVEAIASEPLSAKRQRELLTSGQAAAQALLVPWPLLGCSPMPCLARPHNVKPSSTTQLEIGNAQSQTDLAHPPMSVNDDHHYTPPSGAESMV